MNEKADMFNKRREKDNKLMREILKKLTREEFEATTSTKDERTFIELHQRYAKKYKVELPSWYRLPPDEGYPIVKIDRATEQDLLPLLLNKDIFTNYTSLPTKEEILNRERIRLNKEELDFEEGRAALTKAKEYRQGSYVTRDYGKYVIGFSCQLYLDYIKEHEDKLEDAQKQPNLYPEVIQEIQQGLESVRLYKLAHRLAHIILAEVYRQKRVEGLVISKERILRLLGFAPNEKQIYQHIEQALKSLLVCNYKIWGYTFTPGYKKRTNKPSSREVGWFLWRLKITPKDYILNVSNIYVGCVRQLLLEDKTPKKLRKKTFARGYYSWPPRLYTLTKNEPVSVELLSIFFISERGNSKLKRPGIKVIAHKAEGLIKKALITHSRPRQRYHQLIDTLEKVEIMEKIEPSIDELKQLKPAKGLKTVIYVHVLSSAKELDGKIESKIKEKSNH